MGANPSQSVLTAAANAVSSLAKAETSPMRPRKPSTTTHPKTPPTGKQSGLNSPVPTPPPIEWMRPDFAQIAADWMECSIQETKNNIQVENSVKRCTFMLDCDGSARKIMQVRQ